jgi:hypothetical protein
MPVKPRATLRNFHVKAAAELQAIGNVRFWTPFGMQRYN